MTKIFVWKKEVPFSSTRPPTVNGFSACHQEKKTTMMTRMVSLSSSSRRRRLVLPTKIVSFVYRETFRSFSLVPHSWSDSFLWFFESSLS
jgi:hypothetical protein